MHRNDEDALTVMTGQFLLLAIVLLAATTWLVVKAIELIGRVLIAHPENKLLWILLVATITFLILAALVSFQVGLLDTLTSLSFCLLLLAAKIAEVYYSPLLQPEVNREIVFDQVLHRPWVELAG